MIEESEYLNRCSAEGPLILVHGDLDSRRWKTAGCSNGVTAHWIGGSGNWSDPTHWDIGAMPNNTGSTTYSVVIDLPASNLVITIDQGVTINSLVNTETILVGAGSTTVANQVNNGGVLQVVGSSASLTLSGTVANTGDASAIAGSLQFSSATVANTDRTITANGGVVQLSNSTLVGGSLSATGTPGSSVQLVGANTFDGVTLNADATIPDCQSLTVKNGLVLNGALTLSDPPVMLTALYFSGTQALMGTGQVVLAGTGATTSFSLRERTAATQRR